MTLSKSTRMEVLKSRAALLDTRGPHNFKIVKKLKRKIRNLGGEV